MSNKFIVIGLDGATFEFMGPWLDDGKLPNLQHIKEKGYSGIMESTIPFHSAPAWTSMITGVNPGRHGIFDFFYRKERQVNTISSRMRKAYPIWHVLDGYNKRSAILNIPCTYPAERLNGKMITGMLTPSKDSDYTYPEGLKNELKDYKLSSWWQVLPFLIYSKAGSNKLIKLTREIIEERFAVLKKYFKEDRCDLGFLVIQILDHLQHYMWDKKDVILEAYKKVDEEIGILMKEYPEVNFIIVSDHGFRGAKKCFYINNFLYNRGYMELSKTDFITSIVFHSILKKTAVCCFRIISKLIDLNAFIRNNFIRNVLDKIADSALSPPQNAKAYCYSGSSCGVTLFDKRIKDKLLKQLRELEDPETGEKVIKDVYEREHIFNGKYTDQAADIIYIVNKDYTMSNEIYNPEGNIKKLFSSDKRICELYESKGSGHLGEHARNGIFMACGPAIKNGTAEKVSIYDIFPSLIYGLGLGRVQNCDGSVMDIFGTQLKEDNIDIPEKKTEDAAESFKEDQKEVMKRLSDLGYL
ncbi:alkaline phosphatase family protein [Elusimicrobiota bacterium]